MDYLERIVKAIEFMEENIKKNIDLDTIAQSVFLSSFHFNRLFHFLVGETPGKYLRRRRLYEAARELQDGHKNIIDVALEYGYQSPESFSRAFTEQFGCNPKVYKANPDRLAPILKPKLELSALKHMHTNVSREPSIVEKQEMKFIGVLYYGDNSDNQIQTLWHTQFQSIENLPARINNGSVFSICFQNQTYLEEGLFYYLAAVEVSEYTHIPLNAVAKMLPAHRYALFRHHGPAETLMHSYEYIYGIWFANNNIQKNEAFDLEHYTQTPHGEPLIELLIPILP
jgi:AraC family transcriptional regulator